MGFTAAPFMALGTSRRGDISSMNSLNQSQLSQFVVTKTCKAQKYVEIVTIYGGLLSDQILSDLPSQIPFLHIIYKIDNRAGTLEMM